MKSTGNQCQARNKRGEPCGTAPARGSKYCWTHDPTKAQARKEARSRGGHARHGRKLGGAGQAGVVSLKTAADVLGIVELAVNDALQLENSLSRSRTLGYLAGMATKALELSELEERVKRLEQQAYAKESERSGNGVRA